MQKRDRIKDPLDNPKLFDLEQINGRWTPPHAPVGLTGLEPGFHLAKTRRAIDQAFPITALGQGEANRGAASVQVPVEVGFLSKPAADQIHVETTRKL